MSENYDRQDPANQFNEIVGRHIRKTVPRRLITFSSHPDDDDIVQSLINSITKAGEVEAIWQPDLYGIVTNVENYHTTKRIQEEMRKYNMTVTKHEQKVQWLANNGHSFQFGWNNLKPQRTDADWSDFPKGFKVNDIIHVLSRGSFMTSIKRASLQDLRDSIRGGK